MSFMATTMHPGANRPQTNTGTYPRSASGAASRTAPSRSSSSGRRTSGSSGRPPQRRRRKKRINSRIWFALGFLFFAIALLVTVILIGSGCTKSCSCRKANETADPTPAFSATADPALPTPEPTPLPDVAEDFIIERSAAIEGISVRNMTVREARNRVRQRLQEKIDSLDVTVAYESYEPVLLTGETIGLTYSDEDLENALKMAAVGTETEITVPMTFDGTKLREALYVLNDRIPNHAVNAKAEVKFKSKKIDDVTYQQPYWDFTNSESGVKIDFDALEQEVREAIDSGDYMASLTPSVSVSEPEVTLESLKSKLTLLASYQTNYSTRGGSKDTPEYDENCRNRDWNISKAVGMMQVTVLEPGATFDFNKKTGKRTEETGWMPANAVYQGNGYRKEPGGGVCQVSTTIFNAILRAGITHITRRGHSIPSDYVVSKDRFTEGLGFDATVDYGSIEFKFKNDTGHTIYMFIYITKNNGRRKNINVEIYGQKEEGVEYSVYNEILEFTPSDDESKWEYEIDNTLAPGKKVKIREAHDGYRVKTYLIRRENGVEKIIRTEESNYKVIYPKFRIGPTAAP